MMEIQIKHNNHPYPGGNNNKKIFVSFETNSSPEPQS